MATYKYNKTTGELTKIAGGTLYADTPVGTIQAYGGSTFPDGWLLCDGTELNRTDYPDLFAVIGTSFGTPSANTKFKLPDLRESTLKGTGLTSKSNNHYDSDGLALGEFIDDRVQAHRHYAFNGNYNGWNLYFSNISEGKVVRGDTTDYNNGKSTGEMTTGRTGATTEVKAVGVNFIIKAKKIGAPADLIDGVLAAIFPTAPTTPTAVYENLNSSSNISGTYTVRERGFYLVRLHCYSEQASHSWQLWLNSVQIGSESSYQPTSGVGATMTLPCNVGDVIGFNVSCGGTGTYDKRHAAIYKL